MQKATSSPTVGGQNGGVSRLSESSHELRPKPTMETGGKQRVSSHQPCFRPDLTVSARKTRRYNRTYSYAAPVSGRESWWRVTIKV